MKVYKCNHTDKAAIGLGRESLIANEGTRIVRIEYADKTKGVRLYCDITNPTTEKKTRVFVDLWESEIRKIMEYIKE